MSDEIERYAGTADEAKADVEAHKYVTEEPGEDQGEGEKTKTKMKTKTRASEEPGGDDFGARAKY
jgi:hypothetical protein